MQKYPLVSIIMNCYNGEKFLKSSISSVLSQTYKNWELIFWDNKSKDNSALVAKNFKDERIKYYLSEKHTSLYQARSLAICKSKGEFIAFLDVDDWWKEEKLEKQIPFFEDPKIGLIHTNFYKVNQIANKCYINYKKKLPSGKVTSNLLKDYKIGWLTVVIRKKAYESLVDKFNSNYNIIGDFDLCIRLSINWKFLYLEDVLAYCRWHGENLQITESSLHQLELKNWYNENVTNVDLTKFNEFKNFKNDLNRMHLINLVKNGCNKDALKNLGQVNSLIDKIKILILILLPKKLKNFIFDQKLNF